MTGLGNRLLLEERFERAAARADRQGRYLALLSIELDHYLNVVEQMGGAFGDRLLRAVARRLQANFRKSDTLARFRQHGFSALLEAMAPAQDASILASSCAPRWRLPSGSTAPTSS